MSSSPSPTHDGDVARASVPDSPIRPDPAARERASAFTLWVMAACTATIVTALSVVPGFG
ncbi:hypothetical protein OG921_03920 [Aldersonia sp. NBC_00410]|uniref:hypothetical protein n=1 Tax=Aldersonia sp. NBC_00410 TaxID=2975954 RepID=UPI00224F35E0|nr:hypothetical protein [Aldersonia sp. NBC_00410]MCX5042335.1 hypothetical protein [Aldersonia sp. NBC_00410]